MDFEQEVITKAMEIPEGGKVDLEEGARPGASDEKSPPAITHEQFVELAELDGKIRQLKEQGFEVREALDRINAEQQAAQNELNRLRGELEAAANEFSEKFQAYVGPFGIQGPVNITQSEPHYVTARGSE